MQKVRCCCERLIAGAVLTSTYILDFSVISPLGRDKSLQWQALQESRVVSDYSVHCHEFELLDQLLSDIDLSLLNGKRLAIIVANSKYNFKVVANDNYDPRLFSHTLGEHIARQLNRADAILYNVSAACATGLHAVIKGIELLDRDIVDVVLAGSLETSKVPLIEAAFKQIGVLSTVGQTRPFSIDRDGFVIGEGGALFVIAKESIPRPIARIVSYAYGCHSCDSIFLDPQGEALKRLLRQVLLGIVKKTITQICSHGTATPMNDEIEANVYESFFEEGQFSLMATKALTGHLLGATASVELAYCALSIGYGKTIPYPNFLKPMPIINRSIIEGRGFDSSVLTVNYGFGGQMAALVLTKS